MKNIILFQPSIGYMDAMRTAPSLPLSLLHAACLTSRHYEVRIIDQRLDHKWKDTLKKSISNDTICIGVTALTGQMIREGLNFSKHVKENYNLPVLWGGVHATLLPEQTLENGHIDYVVEGEGAISLYQLVKTLDEGGSLKTIKGIWYKENGNLMKSSDRTFIDLDELPEIPYHLVDINDYLPVYKGRRSVFFQSSRGCPHRCTYCYNNVFNRGRWRSLSAEKTLQSIEKLIYEHKNIDDIYFVDDNFFIDIDRARKIIEGLKELDVTWQAQGVDISSLKRMDDSFLKLIEESGCLRMTIGIESGSPKIRSFMSKKGKIEDILSTVERLNQFDLIIYCSFLVGIPGETDEDIKDTIHLLFKMIRLNNKVRNSPFYIYTPYPGTKMYDHVSEHGYRLPESLEEWADCEWDKTTISGREKFYANLHFSSLFLDQKTKEYQVPFLIRWLTDAYRPIARFRVKRLFFRMMLEKFLFEFVKKTWFSFKIPKDESFTH